VAQSRAASTREQIKSDGNSDAARHCHIQKRTGSSRSAVHFYAVNRESSNASVTFPRTRDDNSRAVEGKCDSTVDKLSEGALTKN
jgi:hypothetical protein